jgi:transcription elongation factor
VITGEIMQYSTKANRRSGNSLLFYEITSNVDISNEFVSELIITEEENKDISAKITFTGNQCKFKYGDTVNVIWGIQNESLHKVQRQVWQLICMI